jgi:hypothetical protein
MSPSDMVNQAEQMEQEFQAIAEGYMHNETTLAFLSAVQSAPGIPQASGEPTQN